MSDNCTINPTFCNFSKVIINYCDGTSFTSMSRLIRMPYFILSCIYAGNNATSTTYNGTKLWFRGNSETPC